MVREGVELGGCGLGGGPLRESSIAQACVLRCLEKVLCSRTRKAGPHQKDWPPNLPPNDCSDPKLRGAIVFKTQFQSNELSPKGSNNRTISDTH